MRTGQARKRDANETAIVKALEDIGVGVFRLSGSGVPDLLTYARGVWLPLEVKGRHGRLTDRQRVSRYDVGPFPTVRSVGEALALFIKTT